MRLLVILLAGLFALAGCAVMPAAELPPSGAAYDPGGSVVGYANAVAKLKASGQPYVAPKDCRSACTMLLDAPNVCWPEDGVLRFHSASNRMGDVVPGVDLANRALAAHYPPRLAEWFMEEGPGHTRSTKLVTFTAAELAAQGDLKLCS